MKTIRLNILSNSKTAKADLAAITADADRLGATIVRVTTGGPKDETAYTTRTIIRADGSPVLIKVRADDPEGEQKLDVLERRIRQLP